MTDYELLPAEIANPFAPSPSVPQNLQTAQAVGAAVATAQAELLIARQFPRNERQAMEDILTACQRLPLASRAIYTYARGGSNISGPSIHLALEIARIWQDVQCGWQMIDRKETSTTVYVYACDKKTGMKRDITFVVEHYRSTKQGRKLLTDDRDVYELIANQAARRCRACILAVIPADVVDAAVAQCQKTMATNFDITPQSITKLAEAFAAFGVTKKQIEGRLQRRLDSITPAQFARMREIYTSLNDGMSEPSDWFEPEEESATSALKSTLKRKDKEGGENAAKNEDKA